MDNTPDIPQKRKTWLLPAVGYAISIASLIWVFHGFDWRQTLKDFTELDWRFVTIAVIFDLSVYVCHGWRWQILLRPVVKTKLWRTVQAVYIGLYANEILPLRTGEIIRCYLLAHWNHIPVGLAISSVAIERVLDGVWLFLCMLLLTFFQELPGYLVDAGRLMGIVVVALTGVLLYVGVRRQHAHAMVKESRWLHYLHHLVDGIHAMGNPRTVIATAGASLVYAALQVVPIWALIQGYGLDLSIWAPFTVYVILRIGTVIPNAPGNAGLYQFLVVLSLGLFGVPKSTAAGFSLMMFGVLTLPLLIGGFIAVALTGLKLDEIRHRARVSMESRVSASTD
ncbi:MAG: lysylphosphatidylglycerol synthase transmembrane domain-containing protein [Bryobacteraceae bacterium]